MLSCLPNIRHKFPFEGWHKLPFVKVAPFLVPRVCIAKLTPQRCLPCRSCHLLQWTTCQGPQTPFPLFIPFPHLITLCYDGIQASETSHFLGLPLPFSEAPVPFKVLTLVRKYTLVALCRKQCFLLQKHCSDAFPQAFLWVLASKSMNPT